MANIIIKDRPQRLGKTRSEIERNMRKDWGTQSMSDEKLEKLAWLERKIKDKTGSNQNFVTQDVLDEVK